MNLPGVRKVLLWSFIGFLSLSALIAIFSVLSHKFGETQIKVLATTFTISAASICAMSCAAFAEKRKMNPVGLTGVFFAASAAVLTVICIWGELTDYWKIDLTLIVISVAFSHALLLWIPSLAAGHRWTQVVSSIVVAILVAQILYGIWAKVDDDGFFRGVAVVSIFVVLLTLVVPICAKLGGPKSEPVDRLVLRKVSEGLYADPSGRKFQVTEMGTENAS